MSLIDRTNERIHLSIHDEEIVVDADNDSSLEPPHWVIIYGVVGGEDFHMNLTYEEAERLHDRLGLITGRSGQGKA